MSNNPVLLFDGVCNLCNDSVQWVIKHDKKAVFQFAALQSEAGKALLRQYNLPVDELNTVVLIDKGKAFTRSDVPLRIAQKLGGWWALATLMFPVPKFARDWVYNWVAKNRYRWFGQKEECMIPTPELRQRFLS